MTCADECPRSAQLHGFSGILSKIRRGFFEDRKSHYEIAEEEQEVCLDREMRRGISEAQGAVDENTETIGPLHGHRLLGMN